MLGSLYGDLSGWFFVVGIVAALVGVRVAMPFAVRPLAALIATPLRACGLPGDLAQQNADTTYSTVDPANAEPAARSGPWSAGSRR